MDQARAIVAFHIADFVPLDQHWHARGLEHFGIILAKADRALGELVRRTRCHLDRTTPRYQHNLVLYLNPC